MLFNTKMCLGGYQCLLLLTMHLICFTIVALYEKHAYYDNIYSSGIFHLKISSGIQRQ